MRRDVGRNVSGEVRALTRGAPERITHSNDVARERAEIARFFGDLRRTLRLTLPQVATHFRVGHEVLEALETGHVEYLPPSHETARFIMAYTAAGRIDGRAVLGAIGRLVSKIERDGYNAPVPVQPSRPAVNRRRQILQAGSAIAHNASRLPKGAIEHMRRRPDRAFYALSLPLGFLLLALNMGPLAHVTRPFSASVEWFSGYFQEHFGAVRDGLRYIEVDDPRSRRGDKLQVAGRS